MGTRKKGQPKEQLSFKGRENKFRHSGTSLSRKGYKTLRYRLEDEREQAKLSQLTQKMFALGLVEGTQIGVAFKVLVEIMLTTDVIDLEELKQFKKRQESRNDYHGDDNLWERDN